MATNFIQPGEVIDYTAAAALASGAGVKIGVRVGVALAAIAVGATGPVQVSGVFEIPKLATDVVTAGALLYWDDTNKRLTLTSAGNTLAGYAFADAGNGVTTAKIKLNA